MLADEQRVLWALLDVHRARGQLMTPLGILRVAQELGLSLSAQTLWELSSRLGGGAGGEGLCPPVVSSFIVNLLDGIVAEAVLDPWVGFGTLLRPVVEALRPKRFVGIHPIVDALEGASLMLPGDGGGDFRLGGRDGSALKEDEEFDIVVSLPPFGVRAEPFTCMGREVRDFCGHEILLRATLRLRPSGVGVFVVTPRFFFDQNPGRVSKHLESFGLYIDAAFRLPSGTFRPVTSIESYVVIVRRGQAPDKMFVAEAATGSDAVRGVLANYKRRKAGSSPEFGALVDRQEFQGLGQLVQAAQLERQTKRLNLPSVKLGTICTEIRRCPRDRDMIEDVANSFFFPLVTGGTTACRMEANALPKAPQDWAHVRVDPALGDARVVAGYFDSPVGRTAIQSRSSGVAMPRMSVADLHELPVFVPGRERQQAIVELDQKLRILAREVDEIRGELWRRLDKAENAAARLRRVNREDTFPEWLDSLPFPLASILWTYHTQKDEPLKRYNQLDLFFEGLTQFLAILVMSATRRDETSFPEMWASIKTTLDKGHVTLRRATLGTWVIVFEGLAKAIRAQLDDQDSAAHWMRLFACDDPELLAALVSKRMVALVKKANELRNGWRGHGGAVGDEEAHRRESVYLELVIELRSLVGTRWEAYPLVLPKTGRYSQGVHRYSIEYVTGTRTPFDSGTLEVAHPLEDGHLHAVSQRLRSACPLLPFMRLGATPKDKLNACYFYNRIDGVASRFVSYHFTEKPEIVETSAEVQAILAELSSGEC